MKLKASILYTNKLKHIIACVTSIVVSSSYTTKKRPHNTCTVHPRNKTAQHDRKVSNLESVIEKF